MMKKYQTSDLTAFAKSLGLMFQRAYAEKRKAGIRIKLYSIRGLTTSDRAALKRKAKALGADTTGFTQVDHRPGRMSFFATFPVKEEDPV